VARSRVIPSGAVGACSRATAASSKRKCLTSIGRAQSAHRYIRENALPKRSRGLVRLKVLVEWCREPVFFSGMTHPSLMLAANASPLDHIKTPEATNMTRNSETTLVLKIQIVTGTRILKTLTKARLCSDGDRTDVVANGTKLSFCILDSFVYGPTADWACSGPEGGGRYSCDGIQGLSPGCADHYSAFTDGNWIDVTTVPRNASYFL
jgi:hypothetical protein